MNNLLSSHRAGQDVFLAPVSGPRDCLGLQGFEPVHCEDNEALLVYTFTFGYIATKS